MENNDNPSFVNSPWFRNMLAMLIILAAVIGIYYISKVYLGGEDKDAPERIFTAILPLLATWVGTVLAFYFGRENFEAASKRYEKIISKLNPELLDDVAIRQIMISDKTMVSKEIKDIEAMSIKEIVTFLDSINKSRMPVLDDGKAKYIVHKSTFLEAMNKKDGATMSFTDFVDKYEKTITAFIKVSPDTVLENVKKQISQENGVSDVFVVNSAEEVIGWLTETLILRYTNLKSSDKK